ncbi:hypothetical protein [Nannocystis pusilla]
MECVSSTSWSVASSLSEIPAASAISTSFHDSHTGSGSCGV